MAHDEGRLEAEKRIKEALRGAFTALSVRFMNLTELPESLRELTHLQSLDLWENRLESLPEWLTGLTQLRAVDLSGNRLTTLPEWLCTFAELHSLDLYGNE